MNEPQTLGALEKMFTEKFQAESTHPNKSVWAFLDQGVKNFLPGVLDEAVCQVTMCIASDSSFTARTHLNDTRDLLVSKSWINQGAFWWWGLNYIKFY